MIYATVQDLQNTIPPRDLNLLTDHDGPSDAVVTSKLQQALNDAAAEINGYISKRVDLPLSNPPEMLRVICRDLALYRLHANTGRLVEAQEKLRDAAIEYLKMVRDGELNIGDETGGDEAQASEGVIMEDGPDRVMTRDTLRSF